MLGVLRRGSRGLHGESLEGGDAAGASAADRARAHAMAKEEERRQGWGPWVGILLALGVGLYFYVTCASHSKQHEAEYQRVIHAYEEAIFHKKVDVYKQEFKQKCVAGEGGGGGGGREGRPLRPHAR